MLSQIGKIIIKPSVITNWLSITMAALIIDYVLAPIRQPYCPSMQLMIVNTAE